VSEGGSKRVGVCVCACVCECVCVNVCVCLYPDLPATDSTFTAAAGTALPCTGAVVAEVAEV
jgi:hypothetical protein